MTDNTILKHLNEKGFVVSKVKGVSMWPLLNQKNTSIYVKADNQYTKNDCILFLRSDGALILHRILKVKPNYYLVSGDNQCLLETVYINQIQGKLTEYYKNGQTKQLKGFRYHLYVFFIRTTRPIRCFRDFSKRIIKKIIRRK
ncbi:MAG: S24/S26 family peptidase [Acholeplasma sp.]